MLACSVALLAGSLVFAISKKARGVVLLSNLALAAWWVPVAVVALRYHFWPTPLSTDAVSFPFFLVIPAALVLLSLLNQVISQKRRPTQ